MNKYFNLSKCVFLWGLALTPVMVHGQDAAFIYGKVTTINNDTYQGQIRWGNQETYWGDIFNSSKTRDNNLRYLSLEQRKEKDEDKKGLLGIEWKILSIWEDEYSNTSHVFSCQFGNIKSIEVKGSDRARITMKNNVEFELEGGSNDMGATIYIYDFELGEIGLKWSRVARVDFMPTPEKLSDKFGDPLFGTVKTTRKGEYKGLIWWDQDESIGTDKLDGDIDNEDVSIEFSKIKRIARDGNGSLVTLNSGREMKLYGSNDVNHENRGITVTVPALGAVKIPWEDFVSVEFDKNPDLSVFRYSAFKRPIGISGSVRVIDDQNTEGLIIFDLDEAWEYEMLEGDDDELEFQIPFGNIRKIIPKNYNYSTIELKNGTRLLLGDRRDVSEENDGLLVFESGKEDPVYIRWKKIDEIIFN